MVEFTLPKNSKVVAGKTFKAAEGTAQKRMVNVYRYDPDQPDQNPRLDTFEIDSQNCGQMVLDVLL